MEVCSGVWWSVEACGGGVVGCGGGVKWITNIYLFIFEGMSLSSAA